MRAAVLVEPGRIDIEERPVPSPDSDDVLIRVSSVGVCGSARFPLEKAAEALDCDRTPGSVKTVEAVS
jgi:threonine dehydrogenase-like Zn-dependent dehydrogenase